MSIKRTLRERKFIDAYIENDGNAAQAYRATHPKYKGENAKVLGCRMLTKINLDTIELLDEMEMTDQQLHQKLKEGLDAKKSMSVMNQLVEVDDFLTRQKYLDMAYKLKDKYPSSKHDVKIEGELKLSDAKQKLISEIDKLAAKGTTGQDNSEDDE